ncbi:MAG: alpha/beta hydrolase family protein [Solirubrobacteraceae bacterium]
MSARARLGAATIGLAFLATLLARTGALAGADSKPGPGRSPRASAPSAQRFAVGERVIAFVDRGRTVVYPGRRPGPRPLVTVIRYPADGAPGRVDVRRATPDTAAGPFPLVVFGHGFAVTPAVYYRLLRAWAAVGYVVAAPVFPLENAHAPGGPDESDLVNQPRDMSFVISQILSLSATRGSVLHGLVDPREIAVAGQSDGGETALAVAYDRFYRDRRVRAAVILSGAQIPSVDALTFGPGEPALLASQGTADTTNRPRNTYAFFALARRPKFLLRLLDAGHLPPYTYEQPQLGIVERVSVAFLDRYLKDDRDGIARMQRLGGIPGIAAVTSEP